MGGRGENRSGDEVVRAVAFGFDGSDNGVNGTPHQLSLPHDFPRGCDGHARLAQMHAFGLTRLRDISAIVDDQQRTLPCCLTQPLRQREQLAPGQVLLAQLDECHTSPHRLRHNLHNVTRRSAATVGHKQQAR